MSNNVNYTAQKLQSHLLYPVVKYVPIQNKPIFIAPED